MGKGHPYDTYQIQILKDVYLYFDFIKFEIFLNTVKFKQ